MACSHAHAQKLRISPADWSFFAFSVALCATLFRRSHGVLWSQYAILKNLFENNQAWATEMVRQHPAFFERLSRQQAPRYLWIRCSGQPCACQPNRRFATRRDVRAPQMSRNVAVHADLNCLSVGPVCGGGAEGGAHHRLRALWSWRACCLARR